MISTGLAYIHKLLWKLAYMCIPREMYYITSYKCFLQSLCEFQYAAETIDCGLSW